ncbi:MAG: hypothetical protein EXS38_00265 [Opitutus sp.]|nr:hypothetical protein [Opitutus sp.]
MFAAGADGPIVLDTRRELLVDHHLIDRTHGEAALHLNAPTPRELALVFDQPWEGNCCAAYNTVIFDGGVYRMYYLTYSQVLAGEAPSHPIFTCYAESRDGIQWAKPELGQFEFNGSKKNNIIMWDGYEKERSEPIIVPFKDPNPACRPDEKYKALVNIRRSLRALKSADGLHWSQMSDQPVITQGAFDSLNLAFWDPVRREYRAYVRGFRDGVRDISTATSKDFLNWTEPVWLEYPGAPRQQLYTNGILPYYRAPHIFLGFPVRYTERGWSDSMRALPELEHRQQRSAVSDREGMAVTDGLFMSSRDGQHFNRWSEAFLRPGLRGTDNWAYGDNYQSWGLVETKSAIPDAPDEISLYATEGYWLGKANKLRRFTLRPDGFVSMRAAFAGGGFTTKPLTFRGDRLELNFSTSGAGTIRVEIQDAGGRPIEGHALADCGEVFGDQLDRTVTWRHGSDVGKLAGQVVRLHFAMSDADLYSFQFQPAAK